MVVTNRRRRNPVVRSTISRGGVMTLVQNIKAAGNEQTEWYPTTDTMLDLILKDVKDLSGHTEREKNWDRKKPFAYSVLDIGAGNGSALMALTDTGTRYAIEKEPILINNMDRDIVVLGTEFHEAVLIDKEVDMCFCNPPFSEYEVWANKIIREAHAKVLYLILPSRWEKSELIRHAVKARKAKVEILDKTDFKSANRQARATVHILRVDLVSHFERKTHAHGLRVSRTDSMAVDPFKLWFEENFKFDEGVAKKEDDEWKQRERKQESLKDKVRNTLVEGGNLMETLTKSYNHEMAHMFDMYQKVAELDADLLKELDVNIDNIRSAIKKKIKGMKNRYWMEFFNQYEMITDRLTKSSREKILNSIHKNTQVEFTVTNAYAISAWVVRNANQYFDDQLIDTFEDMMEEANVQTYKSNQNTFKDENWRFGYNKEERAKRFGKVALEYRIVVTNGGINTYEYSCYRENGLTQTAYDMVNDLLAVARNLGFNVPKYLNAGFVDEWTSGARREFHATYKGENRLLMVCKAYKKGTMHIQFDIDFIRRLNIEHGRLKGWVKSKQEAYEEMQGLCKKSPKDKGITADDITEFWNGNMQLTDETTKQLLLGTGE